MVQLSRINLACSQTVQRGDGRENITIGRDIDVLAPEHITRKSSEGFA